MRDIQNFIDTIKINQYRADTGEMAYGIISQDLVLAYVPTGPDGHEINPERTEVDGSQVLLLQPGLVLFGETATSPTWVVHLPQDFHAQIGICDVSTRSVVQVLTIISEMAKGSAVQLLVNVPNGNEQPCIPIEYNDQAKKYRMADTDKLSVAYYEPRSANDLLVRYEGHTYLSPGLLIMVDPQTNLCAGIIRLTLEGVPMLEGGLGEPIQQVLDRFAR